MTDIAAARAQAARLMQAGQAAAAERLLRALPAHDKDPAIASMLAAAIAGQRRYGEAETFARAAVEARPGFVPFLTLLGTIMQAAGRHADAIIAFERAVAFAPSDATLHAQLGKLRRKLDHHEKAALHYGNAAQLQPQSAAIHFNLGNVLRKLGRDAEGIAAYRRAVTLKPDFLEAQTNLGNALVAQGDLDGAAAAIAAAIALGDGSLAAHRRLAEIHLRRSAFDEAETHFRAAIGLQPDDLGLHAGLARAVADQRRPEEAAAIMAKAEEISIHRLLPLRNLDRYLPSAARLGDRRLAAVTLDDAIVVNREWHVIHAGAVHSNLVTDLDNDIRGISILAYSSAAVLSADWPTRFADEPILLLGGGSNYYHWLLDVLPRLRVFDLDAGRADLPVLVGPVLHPFQQQSLDHIGLDRTRLRRFPRACLIRCRRLVVPLQPGRRFTDNGIPDWFESDLTAEGVEWLRRRVLGAEPAPGSRRLFISRRDAATRSCRNEAEIQAVAEAAGYEVVVPGALPFRDQAALFSSASHVAGIHGAGLANLAFAPRGCVVTELAARADSPRFFAALAALLGHRYQRVLGILADREPGVGTHYTAFSLDPAAVAAAL